MTRSVLITGATSGIGRLAALELARRGHRVLVHGRTAAKVDAVVAELGGEAQGFVADLSRRADVEALARDVAGRVDRLDVLLNNAGVFKMAQPVTDDGEDLRFVVNALAPWILVKRLLPLLPDDGRVVNVASAAQKPVDLDALQGRRHLEEYDAYAQSKLAMTMGSMHLARSIGAGGPTIIALNPASLLATKMVHEAFGIPGKDANIGRDILVEAAVGDTFADRQGAWFDNDAGAFAEPHAHAQDAARCAAVVEVLDRLIEGPVR